MCVIGTPSVVGRIGMLYVCISLSGAVFRLRFYYFRRVFLSDNICPQGLKHQEVLQ